MDSRWMPLLAAALGVLGGVGGAVVGGSIANEGQNRRFEKERRAEVQDLRLDEYSTFIGAAQEVVGASKSESGTPESRIREIQAAAVRLIVAQARVALVRENAEVEEAADAVVRALTEGGNYSNEEQQIADYGRAADSFLAAARDEIEANP